MRVLFRNGILLMVLLIAACALPPLRQLQTPMPPVPADQGRIIFYRDASQFEPSFRPHVQLNGQTTGDSIPGGYYFRDVAPGHYVVEATTEVTRSTAFDITAGQTKYIRTRPTVGAFEPHIQIEPIGSEEGALAIQKLVLISGME